MLKNKKNIAMAMAVATVATSVAPAFAATLDGETIKTSDAAKIAELKAEIKGYLDVKYTKDFKKLKAADDDAAKLLAGTGAYEVRIGADKAAADAADPVKTMRDVEKAIDLLAEGTKVVITVKDLGHKEVDGEIVNWKTTQYKKGEVVGTDAKDAQAEAIVAVEAKNVDVLDAKTISVKLKNNETPLVITEGDARLNFNAPVYKKDSYDNFLDKDGKIIGSTDEDKKVVLGYEKDRAVLENSTVTEEKDIALEKTFTVANPNNKVTEYKVSDLYDVKVGIFTVQGNELSKELVENKDKVASAVKDADELGITITFKTEKASEAPKVIKVKGSANDITKFEDALNLTDFDGKGADIKTIAGMNRRETAIEVSKAKFENKGDAKNIVLVSDMAIADGLAATPFAKQNEAPVLLTNKDSISKDVMDEIERAMKSGGKVYLIGGETVLSKNIESQLDSKYIEFERIAGENRQETSLEIARKMNKTDKLFITGRFAEADAMSVANVAATAEAPILLTHENGLTKEQARFVKDQENTQKAYIVGGETKVSAAVDAEVKDLVESAATVKRLAGERRQETNAKVINEFYTTATSVYVAKSDDKGLVDALPGGVLAAEPTAPVVLATDKLDASQEAVLNKITTAGAKKVQVGYGIASTIWEAINKIVK